MSPSDTAYIWPVSTTRTFSVTNCASEPDSVFRWIVAKGQALMAVGTGKTFSYRPTSMGTYTISVTNTEKECGKKSTTMEFRVLRTLHFPLTEKNDTYTLELWHTIYGLMRTQETQSADEKIDTNDLPQGVYVILKRASNGEIVSQEKVFVP